jgi:amino acid transporter
VSFFAVTVLIYGFDHGFQGIVASHLKPTSAGLLAIAPLILFSFVGFEGQNGAAEEMLDPQRDVPQSILRSGALSAFCYLVPILLVLLVLPAKEISGLGGFLDAVKASYTIYGGAASFMYGVTCVLFILTLMNSGSAWMMCGDRVLAVASADGGFFPFFGAFHPRLGTPLRANLLSGVIATVFSFAAILLLNSGSSSTFGVVLNIAISTTLISYILIFPAAYLLRRRYPDVPRPFRLGTRGDGLMIVSAGLITLWVLLGSWTSVFPGTLNRLFGQSYSFHDDWGVAGSTFTAFTLGTLAVIIIVSVIGYLQAREVRSNEVSVAIAPA